MKNYEMNAEDLLKMDELTDELNSNRRSYKERMRDNNTKIFIHYDIIKNDLNAFNKIDDTSFTLNSDIASIETFINFMYNNECEKSRYDLSFNFNESFNRRFKPFAEVK